MRVLFLAGLLALFASATQAFPVRVVQTPKVGAGCTDKVVALYPALRTCSIAGTKRSRVWCPNGDVFDLRRREGAQAAGAFSMRGQSDR